MHAFDPVNAVIFKKEFFFFKLFLFQKQFATMAVF